MFKKKKIGRTAIWTSAEDQTKLINRESLLPYKIVMRKIINKKGIPSWGHLHDLMGKANKDTFHVKDDWTGVVERFHAGECTFIAHRTEQRLDGLINIFFEFLVTRHAPILADFGIFLTR